MAKRSANVIPSVVKDYTVSSDDLVITDNTVYNNYEQKKVQSRFDAHLFYTGLVTGKQYEWAKSGDIVEVDERDIEPLLSKRIGERGCCGSVSQGNAIFYLV